MPLLGGEDHQLSAHGVEPAVQRAAEHDAGSIGCPGAATHPPVLGICWAVAEDALAAVDIEDVQLVAAQREPVSARSERDAADAVIFEVEGCQQRWRRSRVREARYIIHWWQRLVVPSAVRSPGASSILAARFSARLAAACSADGQASYDRAAKGQNRHE